MKKVRLEKIGMLLFFIIIIATGVYFNDGGEGSQGNIVNTMATSYQIENIPKYSGKAYVEINNNNPNFTDKDMNIKEDYYSKLKNGRVRNGNGKDLLG